MKRPAPQPSASPSAGLDSTCSRRTIAAGVRSGTPGRGWTSFVDKWRRAAYRKSGRFDEAIAAHRKAIELKGDVGAPHFGIGIVLLDMDRYDEGAAAFRECIAKSPCYAEAHNNLGT